MTVLRSILVGVLLMLGHVNTSLSRDFIVLMDGTGNAPPSPDDETAETNIWRLTKLLGVKPSSNGRPASGFLVGSRNGDVNRPWVLYVYGVGTQGASYVQPGKLKEQTKAAAFGDGVDELVRRTRAELEDSPISPDDEILLFGFSRGATSVRMLAKEIDKHKIKGRPATIRFMGIWDTVAAIGIPRDDFEDTTLRKDFPEISDELTIPPIVRHVVHLVALDEQRSAFWPTLARAEDPAKTKVEEIWFAGGHSDIGGGWSESEEDPKSPFRLWQVTLEYMLRAPHGVDLLAFDRVKTHIERFQSNPSAAGEVNHPTWLDAAKTKLAGTRVRHIWEVLESSKLSDSRPVKVHASVKRRREAPGNTTGPYDPENLKDQTLFKYYP